MASFLNLTGCFSWSIGERDQGCDLVDRETGLRIEVKTVTTPKGRLIAEHARRNWGSCDVFVLCGAEKELEKHEGGLVSHFIRIIGWCLEKELESAKEFQHQSRVYKVLERAELRPMKDLHKVLGRTWLYG